MWVVEERDRIAVTRQRCHHPVRRCQEATVRKPRKQAATVHKNLSRPHRRGDPLAGLRGNLQTGNCRLRKKSQKACIRMKRGTKLVGSIAVARRVMAKTAGDFCTIELIV